MPAERDAPVIAVDRLAKSYQVPEREQGVKAALRSLVKRRMRTVEAVRHVSFEIQPGEVVGFLGPNGAGKTTTLKMLAGLLYPTDGTARVAGYTPWDRDPNYLGRMALIMGQRSQLQWDIPVGDSYRLNQAIYQISDDDFRARLGELTELLELDELIRKPARNLSLGERMKCEFAGSLLHRPQVLFLDEPTIGLDVAMQRRIRAFVAEYNARTGACVMLTSHYMADVEALCERVIVIHHGTLLYDGDLTGLIRTFAAHKTISAEFAEGSDPSEGDLAAIAAGRPYERSHTGVRIRVEQSATAGVAAALLTRLQIADLTIEDPEIESVIERVFASGADHDDRTVTAAEDADTAGKGAVDG